MVVPWVPDEVEPAGGWPAHPDVVPVVVTEWERLPTGQARPHLPTARGHAVSLKHDLSVDRARRFAEAWRWLDSVRRHGGVARPGNPEYVWWLYRAGVLRPIRRTDSQVRGGALPPPLGARFAVTRAAAPSSRPSPPGRWWQPVASVGALAATAWRRAIGSLIGRPGSS